MVKQIVSVLFTKKQIRIKQIKIMEVWEIRLNKYIAESGLCSRRDADRLIESGKVTVNGETAEPGRKVYEGDSVKVCNKLISPKKEKVVLAYYKPRGVTSTQRDEHALITLGEALKYKERVTYAGRLDKESEGLLLMTNDGDLIEAMMRGSNGHEKEYIVKTDKPVSENFIEKMSEGVYLKELKKYAKPERVSKTGKNTFQIVLTQGLNREIRRMCETFGYRVLMLKRVRVLSVKLEGLKPGEYRVLKKEEVEKLWKECRNL